MLWCEKFFRASRAAMAKPHAAGFKYCHTALPYAQIHTGFIHSSAGVTIRIEGLNLFA